MSDFSRAAARLMLGCSALSYGAFFVSGAMGQQTSESIAFAQGIAPIGGRVFDENGTALPGAHILIRETGQQATTNLQGEFTLTVPAASGSLTMEISYLGRPSVTRTVEAGSGQPAHEIVLPAATTNSDDIVVSGSIIENTARALNQQRQADNTVNILSADAIGRFPDPNIAEALQRVAGIGIERDQGEGRYVNVRGAPAEFSAVTVDGVRISSVDPTTRAVDLDTIPSDVVANLEVAKSLLPSQEADSIAGSINIVTRSAFDARGFRMAASGGLSHNQLGGNDRRAAASVSSPFGPSDQFGIVLAGSYSLTDRKPDNVENVWTRGDVFGVTETLFKDYDTKRERIAGTAGLEWQPTVDSRVYVRGSYSRFTDNEFRNQLGILWSEGTVAPGATDSSATYSNTRIERQVRHRIQRNQIYTVTAGGEHRLGGGRIEYSGSYNRSEQSYPRRDELMYRSSLRPTQSYDFSANPDQPTYSLFESREHLQLGSFAFRENAFRSNDTVNDEYSFNAKFQAPLSIGGTPVTLTVGGSFRSRDTVADEERLRDRAASASPGSFVDLLSNNPSRNFGYDLGFKYLTGPADDYFDRMKGSSPRRIPQSITADYSASEEILGMFGMLRAEVGDTTIIGGLRVEATGFKGDAPTYIADTGETGTARASSNYLNWFPNLTLRHAFSPRLIGRFALSRGINRPNFVDIVPRVVDNTDGSTVEVALGNPGLRPTISNNIDAGLEYYLKPLGVLSINGFYKDLENYRYTVTRTGSYLGQTALLTRPENAPNGKLYGVEFNWQQQFTFLPGLLSGLGIFANYTWADAEIKLREAYAGRSVMPLPGQSRHTWNIAAFYERGPVNLRVSYTKRSDYLDEINADEPALDFYWEGRGQLDATGSFQISRNITMFVEAKNLTNSPGVRYYGSRNRVGEYEKFGYTLFGGVKLKL